MDKQRAIVGDGWIAYTDSGRGPPVMLVPGLGGDGVFWGEIAPSLAQSFRAVSVDHRGCGGSSRCRIDYSIAQMATDTLAVMDAIGVARADIIGHSTGGAIAQWLAVNHPDRIRRIVLSSTWAGPNAFMIDSFKARVAVLDALGLTAYQELVDLLLYTPAWYEANHRVLAMRRSQIDVDILRRRIAAIMAWDGRARLKDIRQPTLVICPRDDMVVPPYLSQELALGIAGAKLHLMETGGHTAPRIEPAAYLAAIKSFLAA